jgi:L-lysine exporter family protein LysE/ArgO
MLTPELVAFGKGLAMMASLIVAIGVQNALVLRQGLKRESAFLVATICLCCDVLLITLGTAGLGALIEHSQTLSLLVSWGGALFLLVYALRSFRAAYRATGLDLALANYKSRTGVIVTALAVSLLNPHAVLDTVVLVGGLAARYEGAARVFCALGGMTASAVWFYGLAYGARKLAPWLSRSKVWRMIDLSIGLMMLALSISLAMDGWVLLSA